MQISIKKNKNSLPDEFFSRFFFCVFLRSVESSRVSKMKIKKKREREREMDLDRRGGTQTGEAHYHLTWQLSLGVGVGEGGGVESDLLLVT